MIFSACLQFAPKILFKEPDILTFNANSKSRLIDSVCMSFVCPWRRGTLLLVYTVIINLTRRREGGLRDLLERERDGDRGICLSIT